MKKMTAIEKALLSKEPVMEVCDTCDRVINGGRFPLAILQPDGKTLCCGQCSENFKNKRLEAVCADYLLAECKKLQLEARLRKGELIRGIIKQIAHARLGGGFDEL